MKVTKEEREEAHKDLLEFIKEEEERRELKEEISYKSND